MTYLKEGKNCFYQDGRVSEYQWCMIWLMAAYDSANLREEARDEFRELMGVQSKASHALVFGVHQVAPWLITLQNDPEIGRSLGVLLEKAKQFSAGMPEVRRVLRRLAQSIQLPTAGLKIHGFGRPEVSVNGRLLTPSDWKTQSARDLFFYFLNQQEPKTKEQICLELWNDSDGPQAAKTRFKQDIYRLRRAVGREAIVFEDEYYRFNRELDFEYDAEAFESYIYRARQIRDVVEQIGYYRKAIDLVKGPFLSDVDADWVTAERERLNIAYLATLEKQAKLYLDTNQLQECLETCEMALALDQINETVYRIEMRAYSALGDRASIVRKYKECTTILADEMGLAPSEETERLYRELTQ